MTKFIKPTDIRDEGNPLEALNGMEGTVHVFDEDSVAALNAALAARRPLLVRGEPGIGKSQLARAAADILGRAFVSFTVDSRTESHELMWQFDAVARLAEAQLVGVSCACKDGEKAVGETDPRASLEMKHFIAPGPLWWALNWDSADKRTSKNSTRCMVHQSEKCKPENGTVVLIDEIDKADASVPNGLLECLGNRSFTCCDGTRVAQQGKEPPLVVVTTNEERALPDPFLRRCVVLQLFLPKLPDKRKDFIEYLVRLGRAHDDDGQLSDAVLRECAGMLADDRVDIEDLHLCPPGCAEYLDLLNALKELSKEPGGIETVLEKLRRFFYRKHKEAVA